MLSFLSWIYGKIVDLRNALYDRGSFRSQSLGAHTISIGNVSAGGTGKTPLVAYVADILAKRGEKVCVLTRGYGRRDPRKQVVVSDGKNVFAGPEQAGDEPVELARKLLGKAIVIADADRARAAKFAKAEFGVTAFVLDDAFQHRKARRNIDIVCVNSNFGSGKLLPNGRLREPEENIARADVIVLFRDDRSLHLQMLNDHVRHLAPRAAVFEASKTLAQIHSLDGSKSLEAISEKALAFCGLGNPTNFYGWLKYEDIEVVGFHAFPDHHRYSQADVDEVEAKALSTGAAVLVTTAKDAVKLEGLKFTIPCYVVEIDLTLDNPDGFARML